MLVLDPSKLNCIFCQQAGLVVDHAASWIFGSSGWSIALGHFCGNVISSPSAEETTVTPVRSFTT
jgi:hypothetical protein